MLLESIAIDSLYESKINSAAHVKMNAQQRISPIPILGCRISSVVFGGVFDVSAYCVLLLLMETSVDMRSLFLTKQKVCQVEELFQPSVNMSIIGYVRLH